MGYASISSLRKLTNFTKELVADDVALAYLPFVDKLILRLSSTPVYLERLEGSINGTNKFFYTKNRPLADLVISNVTQVDSCDTDTDWASDTDAVTEIVVGALTEGSGALGLGKDGTASPTATYTKTTTSVDVSGLNVRLKLAVFIKDIEKLDLDLALEIRFGSDASNYYHKIFRRNELRNGLNILDMKIAEMGITGSPTAAAIDTSLIIFTTVANATVVTVGDWAMDDWRIVDPDTPDINDVQLYFATKDTENRIIYGPVQTITAILPKEGRITVNTAPTTTTAKLGVFGTYRHTSTEYDRELIKLAATYLLAHVCSFIVAGEAPNMSLTQDAFLRRDVAGAPDEWLRLAISTINTAMGAREIGLRRVESEFNV